LLEKHWLQDANREKGRLRAFLVSALKHFMAKEWRRLSSQRRGGGQSHLAIDTTFAESSYAADARAQSAAEEVFDRQWALRLLEMAIERLEAEFRASGKLADFSVLKEFLTISHANLDYSLAARRLGITDGAARVAVHRLRKRFRQLYREEVSQTLPDNESLEAELRYLAHVLAHE
jgi:RNA polymerase sigma-70 factor (ECF subfamily)